jgi:hypothetical protein
MQYRYIIFEFFQGLYVFQLIRIKLLPEACNRV